MKILIAPDKFKGALNAREVAENITKGLRGTLPDAEIEIVPMADGGEGTAEAICEARSGSWLNCKAHDPIGREIDARYAWIEDGKLAVMEMSEAAGLRRLSENKRAPVCATTFGVGEMILDATNRGANEIIIGLGGSATNDGGFGMARALGFRFFAGAKELTGAVSELAKLTKITFPEKVVGALAAASALAVDATATRMKWPLQLTWRES
jgi:glycerate kinase